MLLIGDHAVAVGENRLELRQLVLHLALPLLALDPVVDHTALERSRAVERVERDEIVEARRLGAAQEIAHAARLELEDAERRAVGKHLEGLRVVERQVVDVEVELLGPLDLLEGIVDERERAESEEVDEMDTRLDSVETLSPFVGTGGFGSLPACALHLKTTPKIRQPKKIRLISSLLHICF